MYKKINFFHHAFILLFRCKKTDYNIDYEYAEAGDGSELESDSEDAASSDSDDDDGVGDSADAAMDSPPDLSECSDIL
jgi:hypothetical protein